MEQIKLLKIESDEVIKISNEPIDNAYRLEKWLVKDISILNPLLAVIGTQVVSPYGKMIDILAINSSGELVIIEFKRDKTNHEYMDKRIM